MVLEERIASTYSGKAEYLSRSVHMGRELREYITILTRGQKEPMETPCGHVFSSDSILDWLATGNNTCPLCRTAVATSDLKPAHELRRKLGLRDVETLRGVDISDEEFGNLINVVNGEEGDEEAPEYDAARIYGIGNPLFMVEEEPEERKENTENVEEAQCCGCRRLYCCIVFGVILMSFAIVAVIITIPLWIVPCVLILLVCAMTLCAALGGNPHQRRHCHR